MDFPTTTVALLFWLASGAVVFAYAGYPVILWVLARLCGRAVQPPADAGATPPTLSVLIVAHNEEAVIEQRVRNALELAYLPDRLDIVVASDGSTDRTAEIVRRFADRGVRLLDFAHRRGKAATLNLAVPELHGEIMLLTDANTFTDPTAARRLVRWFRDPRVGVVCGRLVLTDPDTGKNVDSLYWKYETFLKRCEGRLGALLGSNGAIYAICRALYEPIPDNTIVDDFVIPLQAKLRTGCSIVYDCEAVAREESAPDVRSEFRRRSRIGAGGFQSILLLWRLLDPRRGWVAFTFLSHKIVRWACPFLMLAALLTNVLLVAEPLYQFTLGGQLGFYGLALLMAVVPCRARVLRPLRLTTMFAGMNLALLVGFCRWARGRQTGTWRRTARRAEARAIGRPGPVAEAVGP